MGSLLSSFSTNLHNSKIFFTLSQFALLIRFPNQSGTLLLLLPSLWALVLASHGSPQPYFVGIFVLGAFFMRSAGVVINDLADRSFDAQVTRTRHRPLASGTLRPTQAILAAAVLLLFASSLLLFLPRLTVVLSPIALLLATLYPFTKRFFHLPQFFLGLAFGWGAVMAWTALRNQLEIEAWLIFGATIFWAMAYDTIYALQDREDDRRIGLRSSAILFGQRVWIAVGVSLLGMLALLGLAGILGGLNPAFYAVLAGVAGFFSQQVWQLRHPISGPTAFKMFKQHIWAGWATLGGFWVGCL